MTNDVGAIQKTTTTILTMVSCDCLNSTLPQQAKLLFCPGNNRFSFRDPASYTPPPQPTISLETPYIITAVPPAYHDRGELGQISVAIQSLKRAGKWLSQQSHTQEAQVISGWVNQLEASYVAVEGQLRSPTPTPSSTMFTPPSSTSNPPFVTDSDTSSPSYPQSGGPSTVIQTRTRSGKSASNSDLSSVSQTSSTDSMTKSPTIGENSASYSYSVPSLPPRGRSENTSSRPSDTGIPIEGSSSGTATSGNNTSKYLAIGGGVAGGLAALLILVWLLWRRSRKNTSNPSQMDYTEYARNRLENSPYKPRQPEYTTLNRTSQYGHVTEFDDHANNHFVDDDQASLSPMSTVHGAPTRRISDTTKANTTRVPSMSYAPSAAAVSTSYPTHFGNHDTVKNAAQSSSYTNSHMSSSQVPQASRMGSADKSKQLRFLPPKSENSSAKSNNGDFMPGNRSIPAMSTFTTSDYHKPSDSFDTNSQ